MEKPKIKFGVCIDPEIAHKLDETVESLKDLKVNRSEIINAILAAYFKSDVDHMQKAREFIIRERKYTTT
jgi:metal-responsive CopG/Arc/MetJ family transcriptional regulator